MKNVPRHRFPLSRREIQFVACVAWALVVWGANAAHAVLIASDSFATEAGGADYTVGSLQNQNPTVGLSGFTGAWSSGTAAFTPANGGLTHPLTTGTPLNGQLNAFTGAGTNPRNLSRAINYTPTDGTYYASALFKKTDANTTLDLLAGLGSSQSAATSFVSIVSTSVGFFNGGISFLSNGSVTSLLSSAETIVDETYFALLTIGYSSTGADTVTASIYDGSSTLVANQVFAGLNLDGNIGRFKVITDDFNVTVGLDEFRFGTALGDVMVLSPAPEPSTMALLGIGMAVFIKLRHRRSAHHEVLQQC